MYVEVDERYMMVYCMTRSKVKVTEVWKLRKWPISKSISSASMHVVKRLILQDNVYIVTGLIFDTWPRLASCDFESSNFVCSTFGKRILPHVSLARDLFM